ncbi:Tn7 transposase TnsA N-terminal domain-containing protein [Methyloglobulus sp.]|uniref:Tn7 transposase TnsA N-terminal domain-containing protein n=1 Tax=Methyloglobulus sp. TaxID=2518622 RepID=UPI0032B87275
MKRMVAWESQLEQKACYHFEYSPAVVAFREQPETLCFPYQNRMCEYTPDFQLTLFDGEICYVEVKPLSKLFKPDILERLQLAHQFLAEKGYNFIMITDEELNYPTRIRNLSILRPYLRFEIPPTSRNKPSTGCLTQAIQPSKPWATLWTRKPRLLPCLPSYISGLTWKNHSPIQPYFF